MNMVRRKDLQLSIREIKINPRNAHTHSKTQIRQIAESIRGLCFGAPVLVDEKLNLIAGEGRLKAAELLGLEKIPTVQLLGLSEVQKRALALADNKIASNAGWDRKRLAIELPELGELLLQESLDISITGFSPAEIDQLQIDFEECSADPADEIAQGWQSGPIVSKRGSLWFLDQHRILCGDARSENDLDRLMGSNRATFAFLDVPYNVRVRSIGSRGRIKHAEFAFASGEMSTSEYGVFLRQTLSNASRLSADGAVHFVCCDWRHVTDVVDAGSVAYGDTLNIVVWVKSNAGQGSFYRSQHEFIVVFRVGKAAHLNNIELGRHGRSRSNVWHYRGVNTFGVGRMQELRAHPTVKPVALVSDAIRDCTRRRDVVLDTFSGSGTTIMAAERVGRRACAIEVEPRYVDVAVRRWQAFTGKDAVDAETGLTFNEFAERAGAASGSEDRPAAGGDEIDTSTASKDGTDREDPEDRAI
ncbi:DNA modification methylase [Nitrobacter vulgaris]|uniref:site-specific DNA-methyltransferase n=1 Tax=Nitrobacter vulgaris TaxID=29421 RepID=UPI002865A761|nr:DNA methyltransferase [Nitrobacter vulgaris]MDR6305813.1 DNA modification methylase [Nitrobacter vulgaris]